MPASTEAVKLSEVALEAASTKTNERVVAIDVSCRLALTDIFVVAAATNERQMGAIVDAVDEALHSLQVRPKRKEGSAEGRWMLLDYGDIVVHVQHTEDRDYYDLERLWQDCPVIAECGEKGAQDTTDDASAQWPSDRFGDTE